MSAVKDSNKDYTKILVFKSSEELFSFHSMSHTYLHNAPIVMTPSMHSWGTTSASTHVSQRGAPVAVANSDVNEVSLGIIDAAFGFNADLYIDTLGVAPDATNEQIQDAYFDKRNELFRVLNEIEALDFTNTSQHHKMQTREQYRYDVERKLDALVGAVRILRDPELRLQYDDIRQKRLSRKTPEMRSSQQKPASNRYTTQQHPSYQAMHIDLHETPSVRSSTNPRTVTPTNVASPRNDQTLRAKTPSPLRASRQPSPANRPSPVSQRFAPPPSPGNVLTAKQTSRIRAESPRKAEPIVRDSNYVGALMRANAQAPPQLPIYLDPTTNIATSGHHQDASIVSGLTNPTSLTNASLAYSNSIAAGIHNHLPSDNTTSTNGSSLEETIVSNSTMALNSYGPVHSITRNDDQQRDSRINSGRLDIRTSDRLTARNPNEFAVVTPTSTRYHRPEQTTKPTRKQPQTSLSPKAKTKPTEERQYRRKAELSFSFDDNRDNESAGSVDRDNLSKTTYDNQSVGFTTENEEDDYDTVTEPGRAPVNEEEEEEEEENPGLVEKIRSEILGAIDDASRSLEQVLHVFTLRPNEIDAVAGRIDKAKRQISKSMKYGGLPGASKQARGTSVAGNSSANRNKSSSSKSGRSDSRKAGRQVSPKPQRTGRV